MKRLLRGLWLLLLVAPLPAFASDAYLTANANLRAGPDAGYPRIVTLRAGSRVDVLGCINDYSWCDVGVGRERGWISAGLLSYSYQGRRQNVYDYGPQSSFPIISFVLTSYWDNYYRGRSWYDRRPYWNNYRPVHRPRPPRPIQPPRPGTGGPQIQPPRPVTPPRPVQPPRPGTGGPQIQPPRPVTPSRPAVQPPPVAKPVNKDKRGT